MKIVDQIKNLFRPTPATEPVNLGLKRDDRPQVRAITGVPIPGEPKAQEMLNNYKGWVYACVKAIAEEAGNIELELYKRKDQSEASLVDSHPVLDLLYHVNPIYTSYLLWEATSAYQELLGEAFWVLLGKPNQPQEIWLLRPDWVRILDSKDEIVAGYEYRVPGAKPQRFPYESVIHFKDFNPQSGYRGYGTMKAGAITVDQENFSNEYNRNFFLNSAKPNGALETDGPLTDEAYERIRSEWYAVHGGFKKSHKVAILESGLKWKDTVGSYRDMQFTELKKMTRDEIAALFRVPKTILMITEDVNLANAREARAVFLENVMENKFRRYVSFLNEFLLPRYGDDTLFFDYKKPVPDDQKQKLDLYNSGLEKGWLTRNEIREMENMPPVEGGDILFIPSSLTTIEKATAPTPDPIAPENPDEPDQDTDKDEVQDENKDEEEKKLFREKLAKFKKRKTFNTRMKPRASGATQNKLLEDKIATLTEKMIREKLEKKRAVDKLSTKSEDNVHNAEDIREARWKALVARTDPREKRMIHTLTTLFTDQETKVIDRVGSEINDAKGAPNMHKKSIDTISDLKNDYDAWFSPLMDQIKAIIEAEGITQIQLLGSKVFYMQANEIKKYLKAEGAKFITAVNDETKKRIKDQLIEGVEQKESINQLQRRVEEVFDEARGPRAAMIARTEVLRSSNFATLMAYKQSGVVTAKEWLTAKDERTCEFCGPQDGKIIQLDQSYYDEGDTVKGREGGSLKIGLMDVQEPPLHPQCRCTLIPVVQEAEKSARSKVIKSLKKLKSKGD